MHPRAWTTLWCVVAACSPSAEVEIDASTVDAAERTIDILWVGAHPDDELYLAPMLGSLCADAGRRCEMIVLTRGEAGNCKRPSLCATGLAEVRAAELAKSAALLHAPVEQWDLGDGLAGSLDAVGAAWAGRAGGEDALLARVRDAITVRHPAKVYAFDPRHGSSCHPDHRAAGALVYLAVQSLGAASPSLAFVETMVDPDATQTAVGFRPAATTDAAVVRFDATTTSATLGGPAWGFVERVLATHASQFTDAEVAAVAAAPDPKRAAFWLELADVVDLDARYASLCN